MASLPTCLLLCLSCAGFTDVAEDPPDPAPPEQPAAQKAATKGAAGKERFAQPTRVALIDLLKVLRTSSQRERSLKAFQITMATAERTRLALGEELKQLRAQLKTLDKKAEGYNDLQAKIKRKSAEYESLLRSEQKKMLNRDAIVDRETYTKVTAEIDRYARSHHIDLVVRYNSDPPALEGEDFLNSLDRVILYQHNLDITEEIIDILDAKQRD